MLLALLLVTGRSTAPPAAQAQVSCPPVPFGLSPTGRADPFTMLIRINTQGNVDTYTKPEGGMGGRVRPQDIFVLNTRFQGSGQFPAMTPTVAADLAADLRATFPCNRIIALNGMSLDPNAAGYAFSLLGDPNTYALLTDFEQGDWNSGRVTDPTRPPWDSNFKVALPRIRRLGLRYDLHRRRQPGRGGPAHRPGPAGQLDLELRPDRSGSQQEELPARRPQARADERPGPGGLRERRIAGFGAQAKQLRLQYTFKFITKKIKVPGKKKKRKKTIRLPLKKKGKPILDNLGMQIPSPKIPDPSSNMALVRTSAAQAASCVPRGAQAGRRGLFFFFGSDDAMRLLFQQPQIAELGSGRSSSRAPPAASAPAAPRPRGSPPSSRAGPIAPRPRRPRRPCSRSSGRDRTCPA